MGTGTISSKACPYNKAMAAIRRDKKPLITVLIELMMRE